MRKILPIPNATVSTEFNGLYHPLIIGARAWFEIAGVSGRLLVMGEVQKREYFPNLQSWFYVIGYNNKKYEALHFQLYAAGGPPS